MTAELTSEQIVTNLLISNEILKPKNVYANISSGNDLGEFLNKLPEIDSNKPISRYTFIDLENGWIC